MSGILEALASIAAAAAAQSTARTLRRLAWMVIGGMSCLIGIGFVAAAAFEELTILYGTLPAKLAVAALFLVIGLGIFAVMGFRNSQRKKKEAESATTLIYPAIQYYRQYKENE